ncbi:hypothetical protein DMENIID0001_118730 [Sergentomyia squamirostris]
MASTRFDPHDPLNLRPMVNQHLPYVLDRIQHLSPEDVEYLENELNKWMADHPETTGFHAHRVWGLPGSLYGPRDPPENVQALSDYLEERGIDIDALTDKGLGVCIQIHYMVRKSIEDGREDLFKKYHSLVCNHPGCTEASKCPMTYVDI